MIKGFTGLNGSGKTLLAIELEVVPAMRAGRPVMSNLHLFPDEKRREWSRYVSARFGPHRVTLLEDLHQLLVPERGTLVLLDEIATVFPSRSWSSMPNQIHAALQQLRKRGLDLIWTAPSWNRADVTLREITMEVTQCKAVLRKKTLPWAPARFVLGTTWDDPSQYVAGSEKSGLLTKGSVFRRVRGTTAHRIYDTTEPVSSLLVHTLGEGVCLECGGGRKRPPCKCPPPGVLGSASVTVA